MDKYSIIRLIAIKLLVNKKKLGHILIEKDIRESAHLAIQNNNYLGSEEIDIEQLISELSHEFSITVDEATALDDIRGHVPWLKERRSEINWLCWDRYKDYLITYRNRPIEVVDKLDELTDMILSRLEDPNRPDSWDRRGMVVGSVQAGKTENYIGLINKAIDSGYKLIIVLAGIHNNLRSQTQLRIDEGVIGLAQKTTQALENNSSKIGVGLLPLKEGQPTIQTLTSSVDNGDFSKSKADFQAVRIGSDPVLLVIKKNSSVLKNLTSWIQHVASVDDPVLGKNKVINVPLLLIDDEADNASINTKSNRGTDLEDSVSAINGKIRELLNTFCKSAYVGYTATPFANIFINPNNLSGKHGDDIFPRSFIINVKAPSNYVGPRKLFGLISAEESGIKESPGLPLVRFVDDYDKIECFPRNHDKDHVPTLLPNTLKESIKCFILACAIRKIRGQVNKHNSMLIHVTRLNLVQSKVADLVSKEIKNIQNRIKYEDGNYKLTILDEFKELWEKDFVKTTALMNYNSEYKTVEWSHIIKELEYVINKIECLVVNGYAKEALNYKEHEARGINVIVIGGDKLSRGLTLEGLVVSYFLRTSKMYDTLMQMGRWFGYRDGYLDLCRVYTTTELVEWYKYIALAELELRNEFDYMVSAGGLTPENYGLKVRQHPDGMIITAMNKMWHSEKRKSQWEGLLVKTCKLPLDERVNFNLKITNSFIDQLGVNYNKPKRRDSESFVWLNIGGDQVAKYVGSLKYSLVSASASGTEIEKFISTQYKQGELTNWTVVLISNSLTDSIKFKINNFTVGLTKRARDSSDLGRNEFTVNNSQLISPSDEYIDLEFIPATSELLNSILQKQCLANERTYLLEFYEKNKGCTLDRLALELTRCRKCKNDKNSTINSITEITKPSPRAIRDIRPKTKGLLLIYPIIQPESIDKSELDQKNETKSNTPTIGIAVSFPSSETAIGVEYSVNKVWISSFSSNQDENDD